MKVQHRKNCGSQLKQRGKFTALIAYIKKEKRSQITDLFKSFF